MDEMTVYIFLALAKAMSKDEISLDIICDACEVSEGFAEGIVEEMKKRRCIYCETDLKEALPFMSLQKFEKMGLKDKHKYCLFDENYRLDGSGNE